MGFGLRFGFGLGAQQGGGVPDAVFTITGTGDTNSTLYLFYPASEAGKIIKATGAVKFGDAGDQTTHTIIGNATNAIKVWCPSGQTGSMIIPNTYTRFSANTSDTAANNGWVTQASSPSLAMDIGTWPPGLITFVCIGANTISGALPVDWKSMKYFYCIGANTISGSLHPDWKSLTFFICNSSGNISGALPVNWKSLTYLNIGGNNSVSGLASVSGDAFTATTMSRIYFDPLTGNGLSVSEQSRVLILMSTKTSWTSPKSIEFYPPCASMADTAADGIWKYTGTPTPLAAAVKTLVKTHGVTITLVNVDFTAGTGLPAGFVDWLSA